MSAAEDTTESAPAEEQHEFKLLHRLGDWAGAPRCSICDKTDEEHWWPESAPTSVISVPFKMHAPGGFTVHHVKCPEAPMLTASAFAIKYAASVEVSRDLYFYMDALGGDRRIGDDEAVILQPDGSTQFIAVPQGRY